jgi:hypothetical protein
MERRPARGRPVAARQALGMAIGKAQHLLELRLAERARQIMGSARRKDRVQRGYIAARQQHEQGGRIGLHRIGERPDGGESLVESAARIDHRHRAAIVFQPARSAIAAISSRCRNDRMNSGVAPRPPPSMAAFGRTALFNRIPLSLRPC